MRIRTVILILFSASCGSSETPEPAVDEYWQRPGAPALGYRWPGAVGQGPRLCAFAWDGRPEVPLVPRSTSLVIDFGAVGRTPATVVYEPFEEHGEASGDGRFGSGRTVLSADTPLVVPLAQTLAEGEPWTLDFWVRPEDTSAGGVLVEAPGLLLRVDSEGRVRCELAQQPGFELRSENHLEPSQWNHVALVRDAPYPNRLRLILRGRVCGADLAGEGPALGELAFRLPGAYDDVLVEQRAAASAEAMERSAAHVEPGEHELELRFEDGSRRVLSLWAGVLTDPEPVGAAGWALGDLSHFAFDEQGLRWVPGQWERDHAPSPPAARTTHPTVHVGDGRVFLFSGEVMDSHLFPMVNTADTWLYDVERRRWEEVSSASAPPPRCHQPAAFSPDHGLVLMCGGWRNDERGSLAYGDTWVFHVAEERWEERSPSGPKLHEHSDASLVYHAGIRRFLLFLGLQVWEYDPEGDAWERHRDLPVVDEAGEPAEYVPGGSRMAAFDPGSELVLLFGSERSDGDELRYDNPTVVYDHGQKCFVLRAPATSPAPRVRSGFAYDSARHQFVLVGGVRAEDSTRFDDLWTYRMETNEWRPHEAANAPSRRGGYFGMAYDPDRDVHVLLGGRHARSRFLNEAWRLRLDEQAPARAAYVFDRAAFPERERLTLEWSGASTVAPQVLFQGSPDGVTWSGIGPASSIQSTQRFVKVILHVPAGGAPGLRIQRLGWLEEGVPAAGTERVAFSLSPLR